MHHLKTTRLFVATILGLLVLGASGTAKAERSERSYTKFYSDSGTSGGSSRSSFKDTYVKGSRKSAVWSHDRELNWNFGEYEDPIIRKGEVVGAKGKKWDKESGHNREFNEVRGTKYGSKSSNDFNTGKRFSRGAGRRTFEARGRSSFPDDEDEDEGDDDGDDE